MNKLSAIQDKIGQLKSNFECPICLEIMKIPVATKCGHMFCRYCILSAIDNEPKALCPVCKEGITKRSLNVLEELAKIVTGVHNLVQCFQKDTGILCSGQEVIADFSDVKMDVEDSSDETAPDMSTLQNKSDVLCAEENTEFSEGKLDVSQIKAEMKQNFLELKALEMKLKQQKSQQKKLQLKRDSTELVSGYDPVIEVTEDSMSNVSANNVCSKEQVKVAVDDDNEIVTVYESDEDIFGTNEDINSRECGTAISEGDKMEGVVLEDNVHDILHTAEEKSSMDIVSSLSKATLNEKKRLGDDNVQEIGGHEHKIQRNVLGLDKMVSLCVEDNSLPNVSHKENSEAVGSNTKLAPSSGTIPTKTLLSSSTTEGQVKQDKNISSSNTKNNHALRGFTTKHNWVLTASGICKVNDRPYVKRFSELAGCLFINKYNTQVTHVLVKPDEGDTRICPRTLKYFQGIAGKVWVVSVAWAIDCIKLKRILPEEEYEIQGDTTNRDILHYGPARARQSQRKLLNSFEICFHGEFEMLTINDLKALAENCGASILTDPKFSCFSCNTTLVMIVERKCMSDVPHLSSIRKMYGIPIVCKEWLLDCIGEYMVKEFDNYLV